MATLEERVAYLEGRLEDHSSAVIDVRGGVTNLNAKVETMDGRLTERIDGVESRLTARIDGVESKLSARIDGVESKLSARIDGVENKLVSRMDRMEAKIDRHFTWLVGIEITVLLALVGALVRR